MIDFKSIPVHINPNVPLRSTDRLDGDDYDLVEVEHDLLCVRIGGELHVHPDRMPYFEALIGKVEVRQTVGVPMWWTP